VTSVLEINAEMARISQPIDMANDEFAKLFEGRVKIKSKPETLLLGAETAPEQVVKPLIESNGTALRAMHVSMASIIAIGAFFGGFHLSSIGYEQTIDHARQLGKISQSNLPIIPEYKRTVIVQSDKASSAVLSAGIDKLELPRSVSGPLASIVAAAYEAKKEPAEEAFLAPTKAQQIPQQEAFSARCGQPYQVKEGQTLAMVSQEVFGTPEKWRQLFYVNRHMIGRSPTFLVVGQVLKVPCGTIKVPNKLKPGKRNSRTKKSQIKKVQAKSMRKRGGAKLRVKRSFGNRLITITKVQGSKKS